MGGDTTYCGNDYICFMENKEKEYYKRLILVSDRYLNLHKKYNRLKIVAWVVIGVETALLLKQIPEVVAIAEGIKNLLT